MAPELLATIVVEGDPDEMALRRLVDHVGGRVTDVYGKKGDDFIRQQLGAYNQAAKLSPWCVLVDLDLKEECAPKLQQEWLPDPVPGMCFRIAVRAIEAWLMADPARLASYLSVSQDRIPTDVEGERHPKQRMVAIARDSRSRAIREEMVPRPGSGRSQGPVYSGRLVEFARDHWRPDVAAENCDSLARAIRCLEHLEQPS